MQVESFKVFRDLVESQSFSKAAQMNDITQSAVSQQIKAMENRFRVPLLERSSKRFALTREGELVYKASKEIVGMSDSLQHQLEEMHNVISGNIRISTIYSIGLHLLPIYLKKFLKEYPTVHVQVEYRRSNQVYDEVLDGTSDLGLVAFPTNKKGLKIDLFWKCKLVVICSPQHPLSKKTEVTLEELVNHKFIGFEIAQPIRQAIDKIFSDAKLEIKPVMEFDNIETVKQAVEINSGIAIVPETTVEKEVKAESLVMIPFKDEPYDRPLAVIYRSGRVVSPAIKRFLKTLQETTPHSSLPAGKGEC